MVSFEDTETSSSYHIFVCFEDYSPIIKEAIEGAFKGGWGMGARNGRREA